MDKLTKESEDGKKIRSLWDSEDTANQMLAIMAWHNYNIEGNSMSLTKITNMLLRNFFKLCETLQQPHYQTIPYLEGAYYNSFVDNGTRDFGYKVIVYIERVSKSKVKFFVFTVDSNKLKFEISIYITPTFTFNGRIMGCTYKGTVGINNSAEHPILNKDSYINIGETSECKTINKMRQRVIEIVKNRLHQELYIEI